MDSSPSPRAAALRQPRRRRSAVAHTFALIATCVLSARTRAADAQVLGTAPTYDRLANGLGVVVMPYDSPGIVAFYTLVRTGARDEVEPGHSGFAHLFEHMMFRGTRRFSARQYEHRMQQLGADNNAYTTEDYTLYTVTIPAASLDGLADVESDRFRNLNYTEQVFQTETRAVLGEYNKNSANPLQAMWEQLSEVAFTRHTYGHTTMGYLRDIEAMPSMYRYSREFFRRYYTPDNCTIIVAGDIDRARVLPLVERHYGSWQGSRYQASIASEPEQTSPRTRALAWVGTTPARALIAYRIPGFTTENIDATALQVVHALAFTDSSELYQRLVVSEQRLLSFESWPQDFHRDPQLFVVEARLTPAMSFDALTASVQAEIARIARGEIPVARIRDVVSNLRYSIPMEAQSAGSVANLVARFMALTGNVTTLQSYADQLGRVTPEDVARVARTYLTPERRTVITVLPADRAPAGSVRVGPNGQSTSTSRPSRRRGAAR